MKEYFLVMVTLWNKSWCKNPGCHVVEDTEFCTAAPNIYESRVQNVVYVTVLLSRISRYFLDFWNKFSALVIKKLCISNQYNKITGLRTVIIPTV
jgi:hypothetical protein